MKTPKSILKEDCQDGCDVVEFKDIHGATGGIDESSFDGLSNFQSVSC
jgi:hypothetical protein